MLTGRYTYCIVFSIVLSFVCLSVIDVAAQHPDLKFDHFNTESGLAHSNAFSVLQDSKGFIWIGTERGLSRFDGRHFKTFKNDPADSTSIYDHFITELVEDDDGIIWIAAREALIRFDPRIEKFTTYLIGRDSSASLTGYIEDLLVDRDGNLWVAAYDGGLSKVNTETSTFEHFRHEEGKGGVSGQNVMSLTQDSDGLIWAGLDGGGIDRYNPQTGVFDHLSPEDEGNSALPAEDVNALMTDSTGTVWLGTDVGLIRYDAATSTFEGFPLISSPGKPVMVTDISSGSKGALWLGSHEHGVIRFDTKMRSQRNYEHRIGETEIILNNQVRSVMQDRSGNLWVATINSLLKADLHRKPFLVYRHAPNVFTSLSDNAVLGITQDALGDLWVATLNGLNRHDQLTRNFIRYFDNPKDAGSISGNEVWSVFSDSKGSLWTSAFGKGIDRLKPGSHRFTHYVDHPDDSTSFQGNTVFVFYEDSRRRLWMGSDRGLHLFNPESESFALYAPDTTIAYGVRAIQEDQYGEIWVGTEGEGLLAFDPGSSNFTAFPFVKRQANGLASVNVLALFRDSDNVLWIGTDRGLNILHRDDDGRPTGTYELYLERDGLADNGIVGILEDDAGRIWLSTSNGLTRATKRYKRGNSKKAFTLTFRNYDYHDGLPSSVFYTGPPLKDADGLFYFGGDKGVTVFDPAEIKDNIYPTEVTISDIQLFNESISVGEEDEEGRVLMDVSAPYAKDLALSYRDRLISISFAALHYGAPAKNQFKYRLEGFEETWNDVGDIQQATYTNLPAGEYTFKVIASNLDGVWNDEGASIRISVKPPYWETTWFKGLAIGTLLLLLVVAYEYGMRSLRQRSLLLEKKVTNRTEVIRKKNLQLEDANDELLTMNKALKESNYNLELRSQELKQALERNKEILGITAHDLKNPLGGIIGLSEIILEDAGKLQAESFVLESVTNVKMLKWNLI